MVHKHKRKGTDPTDYDLPPTKVARPLPAVSSRRRAEANAAAAIKGKKTSTAPRKTSTTLKGVNPSTAPKGGKPSTVPKGANPSAAPKGENASAAPKAVKQSTAPKAVSPSTAPKGGNPSAAPKGGNSSTAPKAAKPSTAPKGGNPSAVPKGGNSSTAPKAAKPSTAPKGGNPSAAPKGGKSTTASKGGKKKRKRSENDDTPRAFKRLMAFAGGQKTRSGLDDGVKKPEGATETEVKQPQEQAAVPSIRPGESLHDFSARVDATISIAGLINNTTKGGKDPVGLKVYRTRKERKMHKLYDQWRQEEKKVQERKEEGLELAAEKELEDGTVGTVAGGVGDWDVAPKEGKSKKKKQKRGRGKKGQDKDDPWEELRLLRGEGKLKLNDVAQAPPSLQKMTAKLLPEI